MKTTPQTLVTALYVQLRDGESLREAKERETRERKHKIMLVPSEETEGTYSVWAQLTPSPTWQQWLKDVPLDWAQQHAEIKAAITAGEASDLIERAKAEKREKQGKRKAAKRLKAGA